MPPLRQPLQQAPPMQLPSILDDAANKVVLAIIVSDGDNMQVRFAAVHTVSYCYINLGKCRQACTQGLFPFDSMVSNDLWTIANCSTAMSSHAVGQLTQCQCLMLGAGMQMDFNRMRRMEQRVQLCAQPGSVCPPLSWTMSNRLAEFAPFILQWYYR
jgi:hypothetical protein